VEILSFEEKIPSMNDVFIKAVEEANKKTAPTGSPGGGEEEFHTKY